MWKQLEYVQVVTFSIVVWTASQSSAWGTAHTSTDTVPVLEDRWWPGFDRAQGFDQRPETMGFYAGRLIVGGEFTQASLQQTSHIAQWNGQDWMPLGAGLVTAPRDLVEYQGELVVTEVGKVKAWNGQTWRVLGPDAGTADQPVAFIVHENELYASFNTTGVKRWDGQSWIVIASTKVLAFASLGGKLYAGGRFSSIGGVTANNVALWDGTSWAAMGQGLTGAQGEVRELVAYEGDIVASGSFNAADLKPTNGLARWDGTTWNPMSGGGADELQLHQGVLFGLKSIGIVHRAGDAWVVDAPRMISVVIHAFTVLDDTIRAAATIGSFDEAQHDVFNWTGSKWVRMSPVAGSGLTGPMRSFGIHADTLFVGTEQGCSKWDGDSWHVFPPGLVPMVVHAWIVYQGNLIAGGSFASINNEVFNSIARWDGSRWSPLGSGFVQEWSTEIASGVVYDLEIFNGDLIAAGSFGERSAASLCPPGGVGRWDGSSWHAMGSGFSTNNNGVRALAVHEGKLIATGRINANSGFVSSWDGIAWEQLGSTWDAQDLISYNSSLVASTLRFSGGTFDMARWDGSNWYLIPSPVGTEGKLGLYGGRLVSGNFLWDGSSWVQLGQGVDGTITALLEYRGSLYFGGRFTHAGGKPSLYIARWDGGSTPVSIEAFAAVPQGSVVRLAWTVATAAKGEIARIGVQRSTTRDGPFVTLAALTQVQAQMAWEDPEPPSTGSIWYRLEIELWDGGTLVGPHVVVQRFGTTYRTAIHPVPFGGADGQPIPIRYTVGSGAGRIWLGIHDVRGRLVRELLHGTAPPGDYVRLWDRRGEDGMPLARGVYFVRLSTGQGFSTRKLTLLQP